MITIENLKKNYFEKIIFKNVNLEINKGDKIAVIGNNGVGKTTFLKMLIGDEHIDGGKITMEEDLTFSYFDQFGTLDDEDIVSDILNSAFIDVINKEKELRTLEAEMETTSDMDDVLERYAIALEEFDALGGYNYSSELDKFINAFGLKDIIDLPYRLLSGGERQYVRLALTIFKKADLVILDEPLTFFDKSKTIWLRKYINDSPKAFLIIVHNPKFIQSYATKIFDVDNYDIRTYECCYNKYLHEKIKYLRTIEVANEKADDTIEKKLETVELATGWLEISDNSKSIAIMIRRLEREINGLETNKKVITKDTNYSYSSFNDPVIIEEQEIINVNKVNLAFKHKEIFKNLSMTLNSDEHICIIGANSKGKTTLFKTLMGEIPVDSGDVFVHNDVTFGFIPQEINYPNDKMRVFNYFKQETKLGDIVAEQALLKLYEGDSEFFDKMLFTLSGGEKKRLQILIGMVSSANCLLIDEPTTFMDEYSKAKIIELINAFEGAVIMVTHDKDLRDSLEIKTFNLIDLKLNLLEK